MIYWNPDKANMLVSSMLGKFAAPVTVEFRGTYLKRHRVIKQQLYEAAKIFLMLPKIWVLVAYQSCDTVISRADTWARISSTVCSSKLDRTGRDRRLAAGRWGWSSSLGPPRPITIAKTVTKTKSKKRNCKSPKFVFSYNRQNKSHN